VSGTERLSPVSPIGIFDSGLGGLSVLREVQRQMPHESVIYLADTANVPYGDKPVSVVCDLALHLTQTLIARGCKLVIMASGTSTVAGLDAAHSLYPQNLILGTIDVGARAALAAASGPLGVLATNATAHSRAFTHAVHKIAPGCQVTEQGCPKFVPLVEEGRGETPDAVDAAREYLAPLRQAGVQTIILGCTHFPFLLPALQKAAATFVDDGFSPVYVDPAAEVVREAAELLAARGLLAPLNAPPTLAFASTAGPAQFGRHASVLLASEVPPVDLLRF